MRSSTISARVFILSSLISSLAIVAGCNGTTVPDDTTVDGGVGLDGSRPGDGSIPGDGARATEASVVFDGSLRYPDGALVYDAHFDGGDGSTTDGAIDGSSGDTGASELDAYEDVTLDGANRGVDAARNIEAGAPDVSFVIMCGGSICPPESFCCPSSGICAPFECPECCPGGPIPPHP